MKNVLSVLLMIVCILCMVAIGCRSVVDSITPADLPKATATYIGADPNTRFISLYEAKEIKQDVLVKHRETQKEMLRRAQDDKDYYQDAIGFITTAIAESMQLQTTVIGDENSPGLLGYLAGLSGLGGGLLAGRNLLRRPGDLTKEEVEIELKKAKVGGGTA